LPAGNHDIVSVTHAGKLYLSGGLTSYYGLPAGSHVFSEVFMYDPEFDEWSVVGNMNQPRCYNGLACIGDELWMPGGYANISDPADRNAPRVPIDSVEILNLKTMQWKSGPPLTSARSELLAFSAKGRVFVLGGADSSQQSMTLMESISPGETEWQKEADLPLPMRQYAGCVVDDVFYVCHGGDGVFAYDVNNGQWFAVPQPPAKPRAPTMATFKGEVWISAGQDVEDPVGTFIYSPDEQSWRKGPDAPSPQAWGAASELGGKLMFVGGAHWSEEAGYFIFDDRTFVLNEETL
jgi:N-acetylneuraminic acid mutarotase